jgi:CRP-like cAMP-binding protein
MNLKNNPLMECINQIPFFDEFSNKEKNTLIERVGLFKKYEKSGYTIFSDGGKGHSMFVVLEGVVNITRGNFKGDKEKHVVLAKLEKGSVFGEISLLCSQRRRTTGAVTGSSLVILMEIDKNTLENFDLSMRELFHKQMISILIRRLDDMNKKFIDIKS